MENMNTGLDDVQLTATVPNDMLVSQNKLIGWCEKKISSARVEENELTEATAHAKKMKWKYTTLHNQMNAAKKRVMFYEKIKAALAAGYYIIPNFPIEMIAIRTEKGKPKKYLSTMNHRDSHVQDSSDVPMTVGDYKNHRPIVRERRVDEKTVHYWAEDWDEEIEFPLNMAKPVIMEATSRAMALKIFDRIGICPSTGRDDDPIILGQIVNKRSQYSSKVVSFMIAWHFNTNVL